MWNLHWASTTTVSFLGNQKHTNRKKPSTLNKIRRPALRGRICQEVLAACLLSSAIFIAKSKCWRHPMWKRRGPGCPGLSPVAAIVFSVGGHKKLGSFYTNQNPRGKKQNSNNKKKKKSQCKSRDSFPASFPQPHPAIRAIMHTDCHKSNALSWSVGAEYIKRVCCICIQTYLF